MWAWALQAAGEQEMDALDLKFLTHTHTHIHSYICTTDAAAATMVLTNYRPCFEHSPLSCLL